MDIDQLRTFDRIVRDGSFTKAAARLNVTQATVSMRIKALEESLDGPLLTRGRKVGLTERGATFLPFARRVLATLIEGEDALRGVDRGRITIASLRSMIEPLIARPTADFLASHPLVELIVEEGRHRDVAEWLHDGVLDLAVMGWPNLDPLLDTVEPVAVIREKVVLVASPDLAARIGPEPTLDRVFEHTPHFLTFFWWQVTPDAIAAMRFRARTASRVPLAPGRAMIETGLAIGHLLEPQARADLAAGRLVDVSPVDMPRITRESALVAGSREALKRPLIADLADRIIAHAASEGLLGSDFRPDGARSHRAAAPGRSLARR